ncbi:hypothetical protein IA57_00370 [Mangrovimonas yunxiaonensis]|uniref:DUF3857 domain-containing protein n=1 Tax=Mangrovimonas yunxiaonensis TaxID=1197477 RepID=A0A084TN45_9FLAO|nr:DUF3857 domain-containing protein [Mangrovimonas yunxiaonensis]KFB02131.1 hypothetical protein IA57_00370 [Mangrovimonas yunxiaonensis]GGH47740.1 hypothetical protein GCM10011364_22810 [Mangrovimonas yunxiaonensis]
MKYNLLISLIFLFSLIASAQSSFNSETLLVTKQDLSTNVFAADSTANAVVLYESGNSYVSNRDFMLYTEIKKKIKILNNDGFDKATVKEYLYRNSNKKENIQDIHAITYNLEGDNITKVKLDKKAIYEEKYDDKYTLVKFTFPNVRAGSVITYSYTLVSPFFFKYKGWYFQEDIPKLYSEYNTSIPGNWEYNIKLVGHLALDHKEEHIQNECLDGGSGAYADCVDTKYVMKNIPAFIEEDYMTTKSNYLSRIDYELKTLRMFNGEVENYTKTWKVVDNELRTDNDLGRQLSKSAITKGLLDNSIEKESNPLIKAKKIYQYVQEHYAWNKEYSLFKDVSVKDLIKEKTGSVSEINILLHNLLKQSDLEVYPILLSTRNNGFPTKIYPVISDFNYLIVQINIDGEKYLLDATEDYLSFGEIPFRCLNQEGRLLDFKNGSYWIALTPEKTSSVMYQIKLKAENGTLKGMVHHSNKGYHAHSYKNSYYSNPENYLIKLRNSHEAFEISNYKVDSESKTSFDFTESYAIEYPLDEQLTNIYFDPFLFKFFDTNPFKLQNRTYPIDFGYKDSFLYSIQIDLGKDYQAINLPKSKHYTLPNNKGRLLFNTSQSKNTISLVLKIDFLENLYAPEYYPYLKEFMSITTNIQTKSLVSLKKR